ILLDGEVIPERKSALIIEPQADDSDGTANQKQQPKNIPEIPPSPVTAESEAEANQLVAQGDAIMKRTDALITSSGLSRLTQPTSQEQAEQQAKLAKLKKQMEAAQPKAQ
ncbi:MAG: hypothetical protein GY743_01100, partial [Planctomycetaceae bacterium]|nr:hypothetical protein [Planctomycetaceae bacterium]